MPGDLRLVASPLRIRTVVDDSGYRWYLITAGPPPIVVAHGSRAYPTDWQARRAGQRVASAYVVELETD
jgi:hypothetical protein